VGRPRWGWEQGLDQHPQLVRHKLVSKGCHGARSSPTNPKERDDFVGSDARPPTGNIRWNSADTEVMLTPVPHLTLPTATVRASYLQGETELAIEEGVPTSWIKDAAADFGSFVSRRRVVRELWAVPATELWFVDGSDYIGTVIIRHRLTPALAREGGHIGFHVVPRYRRRGHATQMLAQAKPACHALGLTNLLITCDQDNIGSRRVIEANSGVLEGIVDGLARYWLPTAPHHA
jgi:predicted acetyltransferase